MVWMLPSLTAQIAGTFVLVLVYFYLFTEYRERYIGIWAFSWFVNLLRFVFDLVILLGEKSPYLIIGYLICCLFSGLLLMWGTFSFVGKTMSRLWIIGSLLGAIWIIVGNLLDFSFLLLTLPIFTFHCIIYIGTGRVFLRSREIEGVGKHIIGWAFILWGIHKENYPFLRPLLWFAPWRYIISTVLELAVAIGILLVYFQKTRKDLSKSEERFRLLAENAQDLIYYYRLAPAPGFEYVSPSSTTIIGYTPEEHYTDPNLWFKLVHPDDRLLLENFKQALISSNTPLSLRLMRRDGKIIWIEQRSVPIHDETGNLLALEGIARDISERKHAVDVLAAEKELLAVTLRSIGDGVITSDKEGKVVLINKVAERITGWVENETVGKPLSMIFRIINQKTLECCENPVEKVLKTKGTDDPANQCILIARDGSERVIAYNAAPIRSNDSNINGVVLVFRDITQQQKLEEEILKVNKLESISILAGGIAHDFNNILTAVIGNISLVKLHVGNDAEVFKTLSEVENATLRAKDLTQQLLTFAKGGAPIKKISSIAVLIKESSSFVLRGSNVRCEYFIPEDLWTVEIDEGQISQVLNNLIINAQQAMPGGGIVQIGCENVSVDARHHLPLQGKKYVKMFVKDQGDGIPREYHQRIFDPYFTTKQKGNGLGLAISYSIIKKHEGYISLESETGNGATFYIYLPASQKDIVLDNVDRLFMINQGKILIVDDEELVRSVVSRMLKYAGYVVDSAADGIEAIDLYKRAKESGQTFDAVIMDLTVPGGMGGKEAIKILMGIDPEVKAIVSSGYSNDPIMANFSQHGFKGVVAKPFKIDELIKTLNNVTNK